VSSHIEDHQPTFEIEGSICGFWRRIFAFVIDVTIIGFVGFCIGTAGYDFFATLGIYGRLVGFIIALFYFGLGNSSIFGGQTIGKKLLKIQVVTLNGVTISPVKSFLRYTIFSLPFFLNGAPFPPTILQNKIVMILSGFIVFFMGGSIIYLYLFNRRTRQSLHDIALQTYVVNKDSSPSILPIWKGHYVTLGVFFVAFIVAVTVLLPKVAKNQFFQDLQATQLEIQKSGLVEYSTVSSGKSWSSTSTGTSEVTYCAVNAKLNHRPNDFDSTINTLAKIVLKSYQPVYEKTSLTINAIYGYDIGIASAWKNQSKSYSPKEWEELLTNGGNI
jgi:uncharacterized RDD family membrane protein YckC